MTLQGWVWSLSCNRDHKVASCGWDNMALVWDLRDDEGLRRLTGFDAKEAIVCSTFVEDLLTVGTFRGSTKVYDVRAAPDSGPVESYSLHKKSTLAVRVPCDLDHLVLTASDDGCLVSVDRRVRKELDRLHLGRAFPMCMDLLEVGGRSRCLYVGDKLGNLHLVDASASGCGGAFRLVDTSRGLHSGHVVQVVASPGGVVTCSMDKTVKMVRPDRGMETIGTVVNDDRSSDYGEVTSVAFAHGVLSTGHSQEVIQVYLDDDGDEEE